MHTSAVSPRYSVNLTDAVTAAGPPLLFGVRLWASVCLALYVAFWLQLDNPFWAGTSAAIVCQGTVTLPRKERDISRPLGMSGRCDRGPPRGHRRSAKRAVRLG